MILDAVVGGFVSSVLHGVLSMPARTFTFTKRMRLRDPGDFRAIRETGASFARGPLKLVVRANQLQHPRLGISISRRVGIATKRNRIKRLLREAFRLMQHDWPAGYDLVILVRPHEPLILAEYQKILSAGMVKLVGSNGSRGEETERRRDGETQRGRDEETK